MNQEWIDQYNKKCAEFLGNLQNYYSNHIYINFTNIERGYYDVDEMKFHSDWNWIMKVVEKIEEKDYMYGIVKGASSIWKYEDQNTPIFIKALDDSLTSTIQVIDQFLDWYNKQKEL